MSLRYSIRRAAIPLSRSCRMSSAAMPLKSKITNPAFGSRQQYSTADNIPIKELASDEPDDVLFGKIHGLRTIELNRPKKLNSLNGSMARKIIPRLQEWSESQLANVIVIKGSGRAFCAGGDVAALAEWDTQGPEGQQKSKDYFALEYKLDHLIATYTKPYVAFMDGITMGGGVGLSIHAPFRIATENTLFAMPETTIGFFPDVGASFFLPRMDGQLGTYLALTSEQLKGVDAYYHGIATHFIHSSALGDLESRLAELQFKDYATQNERHAIVNATIEEFASGLPSTRPSISGDVRKTIDKAFSHSNVQAILSDLEKVQQGSDEALKTWAEKTAETIATRSPTSVEVALKQMRVGKKWDIAEVFQREHAIASRFMEHHDFPEGVIARLVKRSKERPNWQPNTLSEVDPKAIDAFFSDQPQLPLLNTSGSGAYTEYPHAWIGLPSEQEINAYANEADLKKSKSAEEANKIISYFFEKSNGKHGVKEKITEYLERQGYSL